MEKQIRELQLHKDMSTEQLCELGESIGMTPEFIQLFKYIDDIYIMGDADAHSRERITYHISHKREDQKKDGA